MSATLHVFPLKRRVGKIRATADKMLSKSTDRHAGFYREQVNAALSAQLKKVGTDDFERMMQLSDFWLEVRAEMMVRMLADARLGGLPGHVGPAGP